MSLAARGLLGAFVALAVGGGLFAWADHEGIGAIRTRLTIATSALYMALPDASGNSLSEMAKPAIDRVVIEFGAISTRLMIAASFLEDVWGDAKSHVPEECAALLEMAKTAIARAVADFGHFASTLDLNESFAQNWDMYVAFIGGMAFAACVCVIYSRCSSCPTVAAVVSHEEVVELAPVARGRELPSVTRRRSRADSPAPRAPLGELPMQNDGGSGTVCTAEFQLLEALNGAASVEELQGVRHLGEKSAATFLEYRQKHGDLTRVSDLVEKVGLQKSLVTRIMSDHENAQ